MTDAAMPGPRIAPLLADELSDDALALATQLRALFALPTNEMPALVATMMRHPDLYRAQVEFVAKRTPALVNAARILELAILRKAWLCGSPYVWGEHVKMGKKAGLTSEEIDRITRGSDEPGWSEFERAVVRASENLHQDGIVSNETWKVLAQNLDATQLIELLSMIGSHTEVAYVVNSLRVNLMPGNPGLSAR